MADVVVTKVVTKEVAVVQPGSFSTSGYALVEVTDVSTFGNTEAPAVAVQIKGYWFKSKDLREVAEFFNRVANALDDMERNK